MKRIKKRMIELRKKSFPEIKGKIFILEVPFQIPGGMSLCPLPSFNILLLTNKCKRLSNDVLTGLIAHELSHFSRFNRKGSLWFWKFLLFPKKGERAKEEREADKLAIKKGYGKQIISMKIEAEKIISGTKWEKFLELYLLKDSLSKSYFSVNDVRNYMKKLNN